MAPINVTWDGQEQVPDSELFNVRFKTGDFDSMLSGLQGLLHKMQPFIIQTNTLRNKSAFGEEIDNINNVIRFCVEDLLKNKGNYSMSVNISQRTLRYLKAGILFQQLQREAEFEELKQEHGFIPNEQDYLDKIKELAVLAESEIFKNTKPADIFLPLLLPQEAQLTKKTKTQEGTIAITAFDTIPILDEQLRIRCLSLLALADANSDKENQYDSVVREAATVLENRIKTRTGLTDENGDILVGKAFGKEKPILQVSANDNAQQGVMMLFKGYVAFVRNDVAHNLVPLTKEKTIQLLGLTDYLLSLVDESSKVR